MDFRFRARLVIKQPENGLQKEYAAQYQGEDSEYLVLFAKDYLKNHPDINFFIFGHRHILLDLMLSRTSRLVITEIGCSFFHTLFGTEKN
jgi:UDP-2,3-diacylglucosamine hydrolase